MNVSENSGTTKSSISIGFSIINHPFLGTTIFGNIHIVYVDGQEKAILFFLPVTFKSIASWEIDCPTLFHLNVCQNSKKMQLLRSLSIQVCRPALKGPHACSPFQMTYPGCCGSFYREGCSYNSFPYILAFKFL